VTGFVRQRGSSWELRVYAGRDVVTGRKRWVTRSRGIVLGDDGLVEKDTKTLAARRVSLDRTTVAAMTAHRARAEEGAPQPSHDPERLLTLPPRGRP
jgi:hypothetical protein